MPMAQIGPKAKWWYRRLRDAKPIHAGNPVMVEVREGHLALPSVTHCSAWNRRGVLHGRGWCPRM